MTATGGGDRFDARAAARAAIEAWCAGDGVPEVERLRDDAWFTVLSGERKRAIPLLLGLGERTLVIESHFVRAPDENLAQLYASLLRRHTRTYVLRFAQQPTGDLVLVGVVPVLAVTVEEVDRIVGQVLVTADEAFDEALRLGFAGYIEREQAWRERAGLGRNPIT